MKIEYLLEEHAAKQFDLWLETGRIVCRESFRLPPSIFPARSSRTPRGAAIGITWSSGIRIHRVMEL